jgi:hypothetical protein
MGSSSDDSRPLMIGRNMQIVNSVCELYLQVAKLKLYSYSFHFLLCGTDVVTYSEICYINI